ncbi:MAG: S49 family peptidase [Pseudoruegeria sp.]
MKRWKPSFKSAPKVAVVRLSGAISASGRSGGLNDETMGPVLERAFRKGKPKAVALVINSPGGSPVQSSLIGGRIRRLSEELNVPVYAFVEDVAASGGYWIASAADEIWTDSSSIVGSVGVISSSFGLDMLLKRQGIDRRVYTAGESKSMLDPFRPEKPEDVARLRKLLEQLHVNFKNQITARRGDKLPKHQNLFTGEVWLGEEALKLGLIDGIGHIRPKMTELFGNKIKFINYSAKRPFLRRFGAQMVDDALQSVEERAQFAQFGL